MKSIDKAALASVLALSGAWLAGCENHNGVQVCSDGYGRRLPDTDCRTTPYPGHAGTWIYVRSGNAPAVGNAITEGERAPSANVTYGLAPEGGVSRGGFGGTGEGFGGGGDGGGE
jgi:hypothetical protein